MNPRWRVLFVLIQAVVLSIIPIIGTYFQSPQALFVWVLYGLIMTGSIVHQTLGARSGSNQ